MKRALLLLFGLCLTALAAPKPNVLFIAVDDLNHWVGHLQRNSQARTPNIDRLASMGVSFTRAYCAAPACNPSRAALMSGLRPSSTGVYDNGQDWRPVIDEKLTLTTQFREAGYAVLGAGKIYHSNVHRPGEWDQYMARAGGDPRPAQGQGRGVGGIKFAPLDCADSELVDWRIADWCIEKLKEDHDRPFFLACGFHKPHMPWNVPQKWFDLFPLEDIELPPHRTDDLEDVPISGVRMARPNGDHAAMLESGRWKEAVQAYLATIAYADMNIGRLLDALEQSEYRTNTIIVFWGDHGWHLGEKLHWRKFALWEEATRAPLIWVAPGITKPNALCDRTVDFMSIYPTLMDLCGLPLPDHVQGINIRPLLADPEALWSATALTTFGMNNHAIRSGKWRYIRYANGDEELYDHAHDPYEWVNLAANSEHNKVKEELLRLFPEENKPELPRRAR